MGYRELRKEYNKINKETLWKVMKIHDVGGKLLDEVNGMYVISLPYVKVKWVESERLRSDSGVRQGCSLSPWLFIHEKCENGNGDDKSEI